MRTGRRKWVYIIIAAAVVFAIISVSWLISMQFNSSHLTVAVKTNKTTSPENSILYVSGHVNPYIPFLGCSQNNCSRPTGLVSYGIYNVGNAKSYKVKTTGLLGSATIYSIKSHNPGNSIVPSNTATLQLNGVLVVQNKNGSTNEYFMQLVTLFYTNSNVISFFSSITGANNESNTEKGYFYGSRNCAFLANAPQYYVCTFPLNGSERIPVQKPLSIAEGLYTTTKNGSVWVFPDVAFSGNGSIDYNLFSSNFSIIDKNATSSYFLVDGMNYATSNTAFFDAEFVFGGPNVYERAATFTSMNSVLNLMYYNSSTNRFQNFSSYYNFGYDTTEAASALSTSLLHNGSITVTVGKPDYGYIGG